MEARNLYISIDIDTECMAYHRQRPANITFLR